MKVEKSEIAMIVKSGLSDISCHGVNSERVSGLKVIKKDNKSIFREAP